MFWMNKKKKILNKVTSKLRIIWQFSKIDVLVKVLGWLMNHSAGAARPTKNVILIIDSKTGRCLAHLPVIYYLLSLSNQMLSMMAFKVALGRIACSVFSRSEK